MSKHRLTAALALVSVLAERFPAAFAVNPCYRQPLKQRIHVDILAQLSDTIAPRALSDALRIYVSNPLYLKALVAGADRVDINGMPAGKVTAEHADIAKQRIAQQRAKQARRKATSRFPKIDPTLNTNDKPSPRRLGLADLKTAAQARRGAA